VVHITDATIQHNSTKMFSHIAHYRIGVCKRRHDQHW